MLHLHVHAVTAADHHSTQTNLPLHLPPPPPPTATPTPPQKKLIVLSKQWPQHKSGVFDRLRELADKEEDVDKKMGLRRVFRTLQGVSWGGGLLVLRVGLGLGAGGVWCCGSLGLGLP